MTEEKSPPTPELSPTTSEIAEQRRAVMERVLPILDLEGEAFDMAVSHFVTERMQELPKQPAGRPVSIMHGGTSAFIGPETPMIASGLSLPYYMDDPKAYAASFQFVKQYYSNFKNKLPQDRAYLNAVVSGVNYGQAHYFETIAGDAKARFHAMADIIDEDYTPNESIADFKKIAVCQERAGVAHNTLQILGIDSTFEVGRMSVVNEDGESPSEAHGFISFTGAAGGRIIFDPTNPVLVKDREGKLVSIVPNHFKFENPEASEVSSVLKERTIVDGQQIETRAREVTYSFSQ